MGLAEIYFEAPTTSSQMFRLYVSICSVFLLHKPDAVDDKPSKCQDAPFHQDYVMLTVVSISTKSLQFVYSRLIIAT